MTAQEIKLVQDSFGSIRPITETAASLFYGRLFTIAPELRPMFKGDMTEQGRKLMTMLALVVVSLDRLENVLPSIKELGIGHAGYGVKDEHYPLVGEALLWTLEQGLGPAFTDEVKAAWITTYTMLANTMQDAAKSYAAMA